MKTNTLITIILFNNRGMRFSPVVPTPGSSHCASRRPHCSGRYYRRPSPRPGAPHSWLGRRGSGRSPAARSSTSRQARRGRPQQPAETPPAGTFHAKAPAEYREVRVILYLLIIIFFFFYIFYIFLHYLFFYFYIFYFYIFYL